MFELVVQELNMLMNEKPFNSQAFIRKLQGLNSNQINAPINNKLIKAQGYKNVSLLFMAVAAQNTSAIHILFDKSSARPNPVQLYSGKECKSSPLVYSLHYLKGTPDQIKLGIDTAKTLIQLCTEYELQMPNAESPLKNIFHHLCDLQNEDAACSLALELLIMLGDKKDRLFNVKPPYVTVHQYAAENNKNKLFALFSEHVPSIDLTMTPDVSTEAVMIYLKSLPPSQFRQEYIDVFFIGAAKFNKLDLLRQMMELKPNVNRITSEWTAIAYAVFRGNHDVVQYLVSLQCIDLEQKIKGNTLLNIAVQQNHDKVLKLLLDAQVDPCNTNDDTQLSPLALALEKRHIACMEILLGYVPEKQVLLADKDGNTPLHKAVSFNTASVVERLLAIEPEKSVLMKNQFGLTPFALSLKKAMDKRTINVLIKHVSLYEDHAYDFKKDTGAYSYSFTFYPLDLAVITLNYSAARRILLKHPESINYQIFINGNQVSRVFFAAHSKHNGLVRLLLENGEEIDNCSDKATEQTPRMDMMTLSDPTINQILNDYPQRTAAQSDDRPKSTTKVIEERRDREVYSSRAYLQSFHSDFARESKEKNKTQYVTSELFWQKGLKKAQLNKYSWFHGQLPADKTIPVRDGIKCFYWLNVDALRNQGCSEQLINEFNKVKPKFSESHLKKIKLDIVFTVKTQDGQAYKACASHELKVASSAARILVLKIVSDAANASLYLGCIYLPNGLHQTSDFEMLRKQCPIIDLDLSCFISSGNKGFVGPRAQPTLI